MLRGGPPASGERLKALVDARRLQRIKGICGLLLPVFVVILDTIFFNQGGLCRPPQLDEGSDEVQP